MRFNVDLPLLKSHFESRAALMGGRSDKVREKKLHLICSIRIKCVFSSIGLRKERELIH